MNQEQNKFTIEVLLFRDKELKKKIIEVNKENFYVVKLLLLNERKKINNKLLRLKKQGIIISIRKNPKTHKIKYRLLIKKLVLARKSLLNAINYFSKI